MQSPGLAEVAVTHGVAQRGHLRRRDVGDRIHGALRAQRHHREREFFQSDKDAEFRAQGCDHSGHEIVVVDGVLASDARGKPAAKGRAPPVPLDEAATERFASLKAWRAEVASEHNLPAYVVFHDATLAEMARLQPDSLDALGEISGVGAKKLEAYGSELLRVLGR